MVVGSRDSLRLEPWLDQDKPLAHVLPHLPCSLLQKDGVGGWWFRHGLGCLHYLSLHFHLRASPETVVPSTPWPLHQPSWHLDCQCLLDYLYRSRHPDSTYAPDLESSAKDNGEDGPDFCLWPGLLVCGVVLFMSCISIDGYLIFACTSQADSIYSVVFASAYRTSVLFTYSNSDPTYTLAPTVGWTAIEVSAGIISACLPTMLPVLRLFARSIGIKRNFLSPNRGTSGTKSSKLNKSNLSGPSQNKSTNALAGESTRRSSGSAFYRLADETESDGSFNVDSQQVVMDSKLRPDTKGYKHTVKSFRINEPSADETRDDIPLQGIRVQTELQLSTSPR